MRKGNSEKGDYKKIRECEKKIDYRDCSIIVPQRSFFNFSKDDG